MEELLYVNRTERAVVMTASVIFAAIAANGIAVADDAVGRAIGALITATCLLLVIRSRRRPSVSADQDGLIIRSLWRTVRLPWRNVKNARIGGTRVGVFEQQGLHIDFTGGGSIDYGRCGIWADRDHNSRSQLDRVRRRIDEISRSLNGANDR